MIFVFSFLLISILLLDIYGYFGLRKLLRLSSLKEYRRPLLKAYWMIDISFIVFSVLWVLVIRTSEWPDHVQYRNYFYISGSFVLIFLPKITFIVFSIFNEIKNVVIWLIRQIKTSRRARRNRHSRFSTVRRSMFLPATGLVLSVLMFVWVFLGIFYVRFNFQVDKVEIYFDDLPDSFDGYRIAHFSDTHLGSFARTRPVIRGLKMISDLNADAVIFSGDLVNNEAAEVEPYITYFRDIQAIDGKFTVLGNHDMGDYRRWYTIEEKETNLKLLEDMQEQMDFILLRNEHTFISNGTDSIMLIGVDNWGKPPFAQYGDLQQALVGNVNFPFQLLISHDPTHWHAEVIPETNIQLTLAGHTHAMQMGIRTPWFSWSPSPYDQWNGIYREGNQALYVNRGFGFLGFPGRIGMPPEITLITLRRTPPQNEAEEVQIETEDLHL